MGLLQVSLRNDAELVPAHVAEIDAAAIGLQPLTPLGRGGKGLLGIPLQQPFGRCGVLPVAQQIDQPHKRAYDDLDDFDGVSFSPPISAGRATLSDFTAFTQQVTVENVSSSNFALAAASHSTSFVRVTVKVLKNSKEISSASWIRAQY